MVHTADVISDVPSFRNLLLPKDIVSALEGAGYHSPSPVQQAAIPLTRLGSDVVVQAKAGTGKTLVFAITAVEKVDTRKQRPQVLLLAPTREVALQAADVVADVTGAGPGPPASDHRARPITVATLIGGVPTAEDERVLRRASHIVVGSPGRVLSLIQKGSFITSDIDLLVLDEADRLLDEDFYDDVNRIISTLPKSRQVLALSATYTKPALDRLHAMMSNPQHVFLCQDTVSLMGVWHYIMNPNSSVTPPSDTVRTDNSFKVGENSRELFDAVLDLLQCISFHQALIFCNTKSAVEEVTEKLAKVGHSVSCLSSAKDQLQRIEVLNALRAFQLRIVAATDVAARGIDLEGVNLVINMDIPGDPEMLMHRIGRAGRFGTHGTAVTLVSSKEEENIVHQALKIAGGEPAFVLPCHMVPGRTWNAKAIFPGFESGNRPTYPKPSREATDLPKAEEQISLDEIVDRIRLDVEGLDLNGLERRDSSVSMSKDVQSARSTPVTWPLRLSDVADEFPSLLEDCSISSAQGVEGEVLGENKLDSELDVSKKTAKHYDTIIESMTLNLQGTEEAVEQSLDLLSRAFEVEKGGEAVAGFAEAVRHRRRSLGSFQTVRYAEERMHRDEQGKGEKNLAREADILEAMAFGDWPSSDGTADFQEDEQSNEAAWREYWVDYHQRYGCWPGGEMVQPDQGAYVRVPLSLLQRYYELEMLSKGAKAS